MNCINLPKLLRDILKVKPRGFVVFHLKEDGKVEIMKMETYFENVKLQRNPVGNDRRAGTCSENEDRRGILTGTCGIDQVGGTDKSNNTKNKREEIRDSGGPSALPGALAVSEADDHGADTGRGGRPARRDQGGGEPAAPKSDAGGGSTRSAIPQRGEGTPGTANSEGDGKESGMGPAKAGHDALASKNAGGCSGKENPNGSGETPVESRG